MGSHKIFVSYKYADTSVKNFNGGCTPRAYVDYLEQNNVTGDDIYKGEKDNEDLSQFKDETIRTHLKEKIRDSSITIVLISPNMKEFYNEKDQWIPWEIEYSLRNLDTNKTNGIIAVVLPDEYGSYDYFMENRTYTDRNGETHNYCHINANKTFKIIEDNMFNIKNPDIRIFDDLKIYFGECSYIEAVTWDDFINHKQKYINNAFRKKDELDKFNILHTM